MGEAKRKAEAQAKFDARLAGIGVALEGADLEEAIALLVVNLAHIAIMQEPNDMNRAKGRAIGITGALQDIIGQNWAGEFHRSILGMPPGSDTKQ